MIRGSIRGITAELVASRERFLDKIEALPMFRQEFAFFWVLFLITTTATAVATVIFLKAIGG